MNQPPMSLPPVVKRIEVALAPADAFDLFTRQIARWWPLAQYCCSEGGALDVVFDQGLGGQVVESGRDGEQHLWGTVTAWDPPRAFAMSWPPARLPEQSTQVSVEFRDAAPGRCEVVLTHGGWEALGADAQKSRDAYEGGWVAVMDLFQQATLRSE
jgi:hypothetical protein